VLDISLRSGSGIDLIKNLKAAAPAAAILVISMHDESLFAERAIRAGASGYLMKQEASEKLLPAINKVLAGQIFLSDRMTTKLVSLTRRSTGNSVSAMDTLSAREKEVFGLIGEGLSTRAIAEQLQLSVKTIDSYREHLKQKLELPTGTELVQYAIKWCNAEAATA
jgi:DNA-binding NarL/FixJ family response regulator